MNPRELLSLDEKATEQGYNGNSGIHDPHLLQSACKNATNNVLLLDKQSRYDV
jgi:hypothetical protein